jgi:hypothetical protein
MREVELSNVPDSKHLFLTKTFWGVIVTLLGPVIARLVGVKFTDAAAQDAADWIVRALGAALAFYGRIKAEGAAHVLGDLFSGAKLLLVACVLSAMLLLAGCAGFTEQFGPPRATLKFSRGNASARFTTDGHSIGLGGSLRDGKNVIDSKIVIPLRGAGAAARAEELLPLPRKAGLAK